MLCPCLIRGIMSLISTIVIIVEILYAYTNLFYKYSTKFEPSMFRHVETPFIALGFKRQYSI
jgi:hypothetical protein